jgi:hypothetical protein
LITVKSIKALRKRVKSATAPNVKLSADICRAFNVKAEHVTGSLDAAVRFVETTLPGWWWKVGTCCVSDDACVCPDFNNPVHGAALKARFFPIERGGLFDWGFDLDCRPSGNLPIALMQSALWAHGVILAASDRTFLQAATEAVNAEAFALTGARDTCILSAHALNHILRFYGLRSYVLRVEASIHHRTDRTFVGTLLGRDPWDRRAPEPGMWHGHVAVAVECNWLCDPTLDQANKPAWGNDQVAPIAVGLPPSFWTDPRGFVVPIGALDVRYLPYRRPQSGFKNAGDARPSHWRLVADRAAARLAADNIFY